MSAITACEGGNQQINARLSDQGQTTLTSVSPHHLMQVEAEKSHNSRTRWLRCRRPNGIAGILFTLETRPFLPAGPC